MKIKITSPVRIDPLGGTLDINPLRHNIANSLTINATVNLFAECEIHFSKDRSFRFEQTSGTLHFDNWDDFAKSNECPLIHTAILPLWLQHKNQGLWIRMKSGSPQGAGLGGSSSLLLALVYGLAVLHDCLDHPDQDPAAILASWESEPKKRDDLVAIIEVLETRLILAPAGSQDVWGPLRGGWNLIDHSGFKPQITTLSCRSLPPLKGLHLFYTGQSRASADNNWKVLRRFYDGDQEVAALFREIAELADLARLPLMEGRWNDFFALSAEEWQVRKKLWPQIETDQTRPLAQFLEKEYSAKCTRLGGAGGGGVMYTYAPELDRIDCAKKLPLQAGCDKAVMLSETNICDDRLTASWL